MNHKELCRLRDEFRRKEERLHPKTREGLDNHFALEYTHNSTAIEGNTLSLIETKVVLEDGISIGGKALREIYEVINHDRAFSYVKRCIAEGKPLSEAIVKDIHAMLCENIMVGGVYRNCQVIITGAKHKPPAPTEMFSQIKEFFATLPDKAEMDAITLAAYTHAEFVKIHPFEDGNGRTSRLIMNYQLMAQGFLPVSIAKENRLAYFETLEEYAVNGNLTPFVQMIAELEHAQLQRYLEFIPPERKRE
jgi:Fic family protein